MTRARRTVGRIAFVGAGPGDPGLLTMRAARGARRARRWWSPIPMCRPTSPRWPADAEIRPAVGEPAEVAKTLVAAAQDGPVRGAAGGRRRADRRPGGQGAAGRVPQCGAVRRDSRDCRPPRWRPTRASPVGSVHTVADVRSTSDWRRLAGRARHAAAAGRGRSPGRHGGAAGAVRDGRRDAGVGHLGRHPAHPAHRRRHPGHAGRHRRRHARPAGGHRRRRHLASAAGCPGGNPARCTAGGC